MAMSRIARGKLKFAAQRGEQVPPGFALDAEGRPTTDGAAAFEGIMLPFGEHKGAAMSWMMDILGGVFTGAAFGGEVANPFKRFDVTQGAGHTFIAIRADLFEPLPAFKDRMRELLRRVKNLPKAHGVDEILSPGEPEARKAMINRQQGVPLTPDVIESLKSCAQRLGVVQSAL
jgi:LDH2 family malate/lactate/ureidoglycolate dehydrogenase